MSNRWCWEKFAPPQYDLVLLRTYVPYRGAAVLFSYGSEEYRRPLLGSGTYDALVACFHPVVVWVTAAPVSGPGGHG